MIYIFWTIIAYLLWCLFFGAYAYEMIERFYVPYKRTKLEEKSMSIKERYKLCYMRFSSK
ncbi:MAG TPA: hypothetical protein DCM40_09660 [Maribacter sp.]|nr:hypothetical protein [Maribacter sp.]